RHSAMGAGEWPWGRGDLSPQLGPRWLTVEGPEHPVTATVGQDVVLPCHLSPQRDARSLDVRWIRDHISETVHHYRNGEDLYREQMGAYAGRTELVRDGLSAGSLDLRITGLRPSDDGRYVCTVEDADDYGETIVDLDVTGRCVLSCPLWIFSCPCWGIFRSQEVPHLLPRGAAPGPELGKACPGLSSAPDGLAPSVLAVTVTLDLDTAHPRLVLSDDHRRVRFQSEQQQLPYSLDRFDSWCCVLGHEEFEEGRHCWLVEVEGKMDKYSWWGVGVAWASVTRTGFYKMTPEAGIWAVRYQQGQLKSLTLPRTPLSLSSIPTRIWVCLDCTQQQVSFINADNGIEIFKFTAANFDKKPIRPWFLLWTEGIQLCMRDSNPHTTSTALGSSCDSPATPASPLLDPSGAAQE
uniref:Butyrophilin subfamily 1 member A1 n=1 Tax=Cairina moschata TaxID=8855 RepID=A0A8C3GH57_CAIMO